MDIKELRKENDLVDLFCNLAEIPSPSLKEENLVNWLIQYCKDNDLQCRTDSYKNVYITVEATDKTQEPLLLSSHMDVIGDNSPVITYLDGDLIKAKNRTLGADDKAGIANALYFAKKVAKSDLKHGGLELVFTRDEESGMSGIKHAEFDKLKSKYVLVLDGDTLGELMIAGADFVKVLLEVNSFKGGHSGIDIADKTRENATKLIADLVSAFPQGAFYIENGQVITSCNIGGISSGNVDVTNLINTYGKATYSMRSSNKQKENELKDLMKSVVEKFNEEHKNTAKAEVTFEEHMPMFEKVNDEYIPIMFETVAKKMGITSKASTVHAGAETHIYANKTNANGEKFIPYLIGLATVCNMHSDKEYLDYKTLLTGQKLLEEFFKAYNS